MSEKFVACALRVCVLLLIFGGSACEQDSRRITGRAVSGATCSSGSDCLSALCVEVSKGRAVCTLPCDPKEPVHCPDASNWQCGKPQEIGAHVCLCQSDSAIEICGDGKDNDCDGYVDNCVLCGGKLVAPDDSQHCGACFRNCRPGATCSGGVCQCPPGTEGDDCTREPDEPECSKAEHCNDGVVCTEDSCVQGSCQHTVVPARCAANEVCDLRKQGCVAGKACAKDADCADADPCTTKERCDPPTRVCLWDPLDGDGDGVPPGVCGGQDCNDAQRLTFPGAPELCDGTDNSCDGLVDTPLAASACASDQSCIAGACLCLNGKTECASGCVDLTSDAQNCGGCGQRCAMDASCNAGSCVCSSGGSLCAAQGCVDLSKDPKNCGVCGRICGTGSSCQAGQCVDTDECALNLHQCGAHAVCADRVGGYDCVCSPGYVKALGGGECVDIDECASARNDCFSGACTNTEGGFLCTCPAGYAGDGRTCTNINECETVTCSGHGVCNDTPGSYNCTCDRGYVSDGMGGCVLQDACAAGIEPGRKWCSGACTDIAQNPNHCGDCNAPCGSGATCVNSACTCPAGKTYCAGVGCVSLSDNAARCGACTRSCPSNGGFCVSSECFCPPDTKACDNICTALGTTLACADCNDRCATGATCNASKQCVCPAGTPDVCAGTCVAKQADLNHCGECGRVCATGASCSAGNCVCPAGQEVCDSQCVNKQTSAAHCNSCGHACAAACSMGSCVTAVSVATGGATSCAIMNDGRVRCWGNGQQGQLGNGLTTDLQVPTPVPGVTGASKIAVGGSHVCALTTAGAVYCWGANSFGEANPSTQADPVTPTLVGTGYNLIALGNYHTCAQTSAGAILCWGTNGIGQHGVEGGNGGLSGPPITTLGSVEKLVAGGNHTCALKQGKAYCWGDNSWGQIGMGTSSGIQYTPLAVAALSNVSDVTAGPAHTCAVQAGSVYCWGFGRGGTLGNGSSLDQPSPTKVAGVSTAVSVHAGGNHTCAVLSDKSIVCWGDGSRGQLGQGVFVSTLSATATVVGGANLSGLSLGNSHTCAITAAASVACWGNRASYATTFDTDLNVPQNISW